MSPDTPTLRYAVMTAAHNEERYLEKTIEAVVQQSAKPLRWVIVSDASTDGTDAIIRRYQRLYTWIDYIRSEVEHERNFGAKVRCLRMAYRALARESFEVLVSLDADITFGPEYFAVLLKKLQAQSALGVVGTLYMEGGRELYGRRYRNRENVSGGCQVFRRECFDEIGGYLDISKGGEDWAAATMARMSGWRTESLDEPLYIHHRQLGRAECSFFRARIDHGERDYLTGGHPLWQVFRAAYQAGRRPFLIGGLGLFLGYFNLFVRGRAPAVPRSVVDFHRREQMNRLKTLIFRARKDVPK